MMNLSKYSQSCQQIFECAYIESQYLNHFYIGTEHLLICLLKSEDDTLINIFKHFSINPFIRRELRAKISSPNTSMWGNGLIFTPRVNQILENSEKTALKYNSAIINPVHLFLSTLRGGEGVSNRFLKSSGYDTKIISDYIEKDLEFEISLNKSIPSYKFTPVLNKIGRDLTLLARQNKLEPVFGRDEITKKIMQILLLKKKNNIILLGDAGVGKTAVVEGLALKLSSDNTKEEYRKLRIIEVNVSEIIEGATYRGDFEKKLNSIISEASENRDIILFFDEIHNLIGAGRTSESGIDASNILKPALARGELKCIGATTITEYRKYFEKDEAFNRRFNTVIVPEISESEAVNLLMKIKHTYESHYNLKIEDSAIKTAVDLSVRFITNRKLPDKAMDVIDQAASKKKFLSFSIPDKDSNDEHNTVPSDVVTENDICLMVSEITGIPMHNLSKNDTDNLLSLDDILKKRIVGQDDAIEKVAGIIKMAKFGLNDSNKPLAVMMLLGPSGVGKTELVKAVADYLFDNDKNILRIDMSEFMESHSTSKLIGSPPGYIGFGEEGQLTGKIKTYPYSVILLDEIEKAHPDVLNLFLQLFDEGRLTDAKGITVDFTNTIIFLTSNLFVKNKTLGFDIFKSDNNADMTAFVDYEESLKYVKKFFKPEFINRIDKLIFFNNLNRNNLVEILRLYIDKYNRKLKSKNVALFLDELSFDYLIKKGYDESFGARELYRIVTSEVFEPVAEKLMKNIFKSGETIFVSVENDNLVFLSKNDLKTI